MDFLVEMQKSVAERSCGVIIKAQNYEFFFIN